jgi:hypothetical protein
MGKKKIRSIQIIGLLTLSLSFFSCKQCVTCSQCPPGVSLNSEEICEDDFNNKEAFNLQIQINEGYGCTCAKE